MTYFMHLRNAAPIRRVIVAFLSSLLFLGVLETSYAQTANPGAIGGAPRTLSYQGVLSDGEKPVVDGKHQITVTLYSDEKGSSQVWSSSYTAETKGGVFSLLLGSGDKALPDAAAMDKPMWVGVKFDNSNEMRPLTQLSASPYAINVPDNSITANKMATDYVGSISIDGQKVSSKGSDINFTSGDGMQLAFDPATNSVLMSPQASGMGGKGAKTQAGGGSWLVGGNSFGGGCTSPYLGTNTQDHLTLGTNGTTNLTLWSAGCNLGCTADRVQVLNPTSQSLFEVRSNGHAIDNEILGSCATVEPGATYNDNTIVAWAKVPAPSVNTIGPNSPTALTGGVKGFGISCTTPPQWSYNTCLVTLNVANCDGSPLLSDPNDDASIVVTLVSDFATGQIGEPYPAPTSDNFPTPDPLGPNPLLSLIPAFATVTKLGSQAGSQQFNFVGPLLPNQFVVKTYGIAIRNSMACNDCFGPSPFVIYEWPFPFNVQVTSRHP